MTNDSSQDHWVPLVEFSVKKGISLSTLRRYIKSNKILWKLKEGRYLVLDDGSLQAPRKHLPDQLDPAVSKKKDVESRLKTLEAELQAANEELAELKTLVAFYEEKWSQIPNKK